MSYAAYLSDEEKMANIKASKALYREKNREKLRAYNVEYQRNSRSTPEGKDLDSKKQEYWRRVHREKILSLENVSSLYPDDKTKLCAGCKEIKPFSEFYKDRFRYGGSSSYCKPCGRTQRQEYNKKNPDKSRSSRLKNVFGITIDDYNRMFLEQNGKCACCHKHQSEFKRRLAVDHCHRSGKVRALLCTTCNTALGMIKENVETLKEMISYLNKFPEVV